MTYMSEEEKLRRIQREEERRKREEAMLQEEELRHIRELERIRQMNGPTEDDYDPEMDSAFIEEDTSQQYIQNPLETPVQKYVQQPQQYGQQPQQYGQQPGVQVPPARREEEQYVQQPQQYGQQPGQYGQQPGVQVPPVRREEEQYGQQPQQYGRQTEQYAGVQSGQQQRQTRGAGQMKKPNTKPAYEEYDDDDDDGADFDVAAYRAAEREKKQRMHNKYAETEDKSSHKKKKNHGNDAGRNVNAGYSGNGGNGYGTDGYQDGGYNDAGGDGGRKSKKKKKHPIRNFFMFIIIILLLLLVAGGLIVNSILSKFKHFDSEVSQRADSMKGKQINILLVGEDAREGEEGQRTDAMILCTINKDNGTVVLTSLMRDMYVDIPGYGGNRINAAYSFGGIDLLDQTIEENFDITIDGNALVDLSSFLESMTAVGDIEMDLTAEEAQYMNENPQAGTATDISDEVWDLHEGKNSLTAAQALCYARMRYVGNSDWERTDRQRRLIMACVNKVKHGHPLSGIKMANDVAPCISTDLSKSGFLKLGWGFLKGGDMQSYRLPVDGYYYADDIDGMSVLVPDVEANANLLHEFMSGEYSDSESDE